MTTMNLPVLSNVGGLERYLTEIRTFPLLEAEEEYMLARRFRDHEDIAAAHRLVTAHLRLVAKVAMGYRGYGLPVSDLIAEGNIGLMQAVKKFDPEKGFRLATYALWWIRASIQEFILKSWSLVKIGTSAVQKRLFFNLRRLKNQLGAYESGDLSPEHTREIADYLQVNESDVTDMNRRLLGGDKYLHDPVGEEGDTAMIDLLEDPGESPETMLLEAQEDDSRRALLARALTTLNDRERDILFARRLQDEPVTLEDLSQRHGISRERVRQIENRAMEKLQNLAQTPAS